VRVGRVRGSCYERPDLVLNAWEQIISVSRVPLASSPPVYILFPRLTLRWLQTHHPDVVAVSALRCGLLPCSNEGCLSLAVLSKSRHPFEGTATDPSEKERLASALGPTAMSLLLNNHGVVCCGATVPQALRNIWVFTKAATYQVRALSAAGGDVDRLVMPSAEVVDVCLARELKQQDAPLGQVEFDAWLRGSAI
jgi:ribulose-5-phosphate 4-epimerase/fuculose-1-phosphate aldolase